MNRAVAVPAASMDAVKAVHASVIQLRKDRRGTALASFAAAAGAAGFAAAAGGFGVTGAVGPTFAAGGGVAGGGVAGGVVGLDSSSLIGISSKK